MAHAAIGIERTVGAPQDRATMAALLRNPRSALEIRDVAVAIGVVVTLLGVAVLAGWTLRVGVQLFGFPGAGAMKANTALAFVLAGTALTLMARRRAEWRMHAAARLCALVVAAFGVVVLAQYAFGLDLGLDQALVIDRTTAQFPGRTGPVAAFNFILIGLALALAGMTRRLPQLVAQQAAVLALSICYAILLGIALDADAVRDLLGPYRFTLQAMAGQLLLVIGLLCLHPQQGIVRVIRGTGAGGTLARRGLPFLLLVPPALAWVYSRFQATHMIDTELGIALFAGALVFAALSLIVWQLDALETVDIERLRLDDALAELKRTEAALRESEDKFRFVFDHSQIGKSITYPDGKFDPNPAYCQMLGYSREELRYRTWQDVTLLEDLAKSERVTAQLMTGPQQSAHFTKRFVHKDGSIVWGDVSTHLRRDEHGRPLYFITSVADITERKRIERALEEKNIELETASAAKDRFLASMSHELRTPLTAIMGYAGTLLMKLAGPLTAEQEKQLATMRASGKHLLSLINDLLDLAKIESGKIEINLEPLSCQAVIAVVAGTLQPLVEAKGLRLEVDAPKEDVIVRADRRALSQIVLNLVNNSIKFTKTGGDIRIAVARVQDGARTAGAITVSDTGIGIAPEDQEKLFQAFAQFSTDKGRPEDGSGLGLYISQKLAHLIGGRITFESVLGRGSSFTLSIEEK